MLRRARDERKHRVRNLSFRPVRSHKISRTTSCSDNTRQSYVSNVSSREREREKHRILGARLISAKIPSKRVIERHARPITRLLGIIRDRNTENERTALRDDPATTLDSIGLDGWTKSENSRAVSGYPPVHTKRNVSARNQAERSPGR